MKVLYNKIGKGYDKNRSSDPRISNKIYELLELTKGDSIVDIGAGTGNYALDFAQKGIKIYAVEPSQKMISQKKDHPNIKWIKNSAENLDLDVSTFDGVYSTLAIHHFKSRKKAFERIYDVLKPNKNLVIFSADPRQIDANCWLKDYFEILIQKAEKSYPPVNSLKRELEHLFKNDVSIIPFRIPSDLKDGFFYAGWQNPEKYLDLNYRNSISVFAKFPDKLVNPLLKRLEKDILNGTWNEKYNHIRELNEYNGGYYFLKVTKHA